MKANSYAEKMDDAYQSNPEGAEGSWKIGILIRGSGGGR